MIACFDVDYKENKAQAACLVVDTWQAAAPVKAYSCIVEPIANYESGQFYKRELPCILKLYELVDLPISCMVVDSYVWLNSLYKPGLGAYLYEHFQQQIPVVGIAKNAFKETNLLAKPMLRGSSKKPLYITSAGIDLKEAAECVQKMHGTHRIPSILKAVDHLARDW